MNLSIIIISWNTRELTLKCLRSIFDYIKNINLEVFLVDNNSSDGTVAAVAEYKKENNLENLKIIVNKENVGFAKANNVALESILSDRADGRGSRRIPDEHGEVEKKEENFIFLLNPDTELINGVGSLQSPRPLTSERSDGGQADWSENAQTGSSQETGANKIGLLAALEFMKQNSACGILGPKLLNSDGSLQKSCRRFPKLLDQIFVQLKFYNFFPEKIDSVKEYFMLDFKHDEIKEVDQIMGAAMLIKREVFNKIGLLDENFWAVFEEVDFCLRAKEAGYKTYFFPDWQIIHHKEQSFKQVRSMRKQINFNKSLYHYFRQHKPFWQLFILWLLQPINLLLTWFSSITGARKFFGKRKDL